MEDPAINPKPIDPSEPTANANRPAGSNSSWRKGQTFSTALLVIVAVAVAFFLKAYVIQPYVVDGESMRPTLQNNDRLLVDKLPRTIARLDHHAYVPKRGDIIIFNKDNLPNYVGTKQLVKRVIALPGERVVVKNGQVTVYSQVDPAGFDPDESGKYNINVTDLGNLDVTLKSDQIFVCGDNRPNSEDSRDFGPISLNAIVGKLTLRVWPISQTKHF